MHEQVFGSSRRAITREWLELLPAEPWLLVSISAPASKCAWAAARTPASQAMGEECPELSLPLRPSPRPQIGQLSGMGLCAVRLLLGVSFGARVQSLLFCRAGHCNLTCTHAISVYRITRLPAHSAQVSYIPGLSGACAMHAGSGTCWAGPCCRTFVQGRRGGSVLA